ncbi:MAG: response regulator [Gemmatimonadaceae bacterium]
MTVPPTVRVVLADDHPIVREGIRSLLNAQPGIRVVAEAADGESAVRRVCEFSPDVAVLDLSMPVLGGVEAAERMRQEAPGTRVLVLTVHEDGGYAERVLEAGARGYVVKRAAADDLVNAVRTVASGGIYLDPAVAPTVLGRLRGRRPGVHQPAAEGASAPSAALSEREMQVARLVARGFTNKEVATRLGIRTKTVETYKARITEKLGVRSRADLVRYALGRGWLADE